MPGTNGEDARERLGIIKSCNDGFKIAEEDLRLRGGGEFFGTRQSGRMLSEIKNLRFPVETVFTAKAVSDEAFSGGYDVSALMRAALSRYEQLAGVAMN